MTGHPDYQGTPLTTGADQAGVLALAVPANSSVSKYVKFAKPGYTGNVKPIYTGANGTNPYMEVQWNWVDANPQTDTLHSQKWIVPVRPNVYYNPTFINGPARSQWAQVIATNLDPGFAMTLNANLWETTQHIARDDWRDGSPLGYFPAAGTQAPPGCDPELNELANFSTTVSAQTFYALPLYAGQAWLSASIAPSAGGSVSFAIVRSLSGNGAVYQSPAVTGTTLFNSASITLPREPCTLVLTAPATGGLFIISLTSMEYVS